MNFRRAVFSEKAEILKLLVLCFPAVWKASAYFQKHLELENSFIAEEEGVIVGHVGLVRMPVSDGLGGILTFDGVASVAVHPQFRKRGIAAALCRIAASWSLANGAAALPLYTEFYPVYESCGWKKIPFLKPFVVSRKKERRDIIAVQTAGNNLSAGQQGKVKEFYANGRDFYGKICRERYGDAFDRNKIFNSAENHFFIYDGGYALLCDGAVAEIYTAKDSDNAFVADMIQQVLVDCGKDELVFQLPFEFCSELENCGFQCCETMADPFHHEGPMLLFGKACSVVPAMPLADKF